MDRWKSKAWNKCLVRVTTQQLALQHHAPFPLSHRDYVRTDLFRPLLEDEVDKRCRRLQRELDFKCQQNNRQQLMTKNRQILRVSDHFWQFIHFHSFISIDLCQIIHFNEFISNSFISNNSFQPIHVYSFTSIQSLQFIHFN